MAAIDHMQIFDDGDDMLFGDVDLFGSGVPCIAGELELQVQSYEGAGDLAVGDSAAGKSFSLTKDSGGSSLSALAAADFCDADFMDNVSLDDLAAADHYGHTVCGRQSTADSAAAAGTGRALAAGESWTAPDAQPARTASMVAAEPQQRGHDAQDQHNYQPQESSDCDMSHTLGDGESSGVGPGKSVALGSSHSEASEDNTAGVAAEGATLDEEHISMPTFGLSLSRLTNSAGEPTEDNADAPRSGSVTQGDRQCHQQQRAQQASMPRAFSVGNFASVGNTLTACPDSSTLQLEGLRRAQVMRSYSYIDPDTLPTDFSLGCGDTGTPFSFGARGRCASLNETQLRRQWLQEGELLAPQLPPSVSELELLELPEDSIPIRPTRGSFLGQPSAGRGSGQASARQLGSGMMQFKGGSGAASSNGAAPPSRHSVTVTVKRKIITSPSPLLPQPKPSKVRHAATPAPPGATPKGQSPKRAKVAPGVAAGGFGAWQDGAAAPPSSAGLLAGWHPSRQASLGLAGSMKTVRSMPANMNSFLDGVEVTVQPLGVPGGVDTVISPNNSTISASTPHQPFVRGTFFDAAGAAAAGRPAGVPIAMPMPHATAAPAARAGKSKAAAQALPPPVMMPGMGLGSVPSGFGAPGMAVGPDGKRLGPVPSVPKPRKRASPNGNPPKAPAPNPNGHCCTQCGTQTTPVWRAGPHGPKTLCNACGVRYMKVAKGNVAPTPRRQQH